MLGSVAFQDAQKPDRSVSRQLKNQTDHGISKKLEKTENMKFGVLTGKPDNLFISEINSMFGYLICQENK